MCHQHNVFVCYCDLDEDQIIFYSTLLQKANKSQGVHILFMGIYFMEDIMHWGNVCH